MARLGLALVLMAVCLLSLVHASTALKQFNSSDYFFKKGTLLSGNINYTNVSDSSSLRMLEAPINSTKGMACFQLSASATIPQYQQWLENGWSATAPASTPATAGNTQWIRVAASPIRNQNLLGTLDSGSDIDLQAWNGSSWSPTTEFTAAASTAALRSFDIAYEQLSGRAIGVFANATQQRLTYRIWNGSEWGANQMITIGTAAAINQIVALKPQPNSNNIMLLVSATATTPDLYAMLWNGTSFNTSTLLTVTTELDTTSDMESFDGGWEEQSGDFNVFYGEDTQLTIFRRTFSGGAWGAPAAGASGGDGDVRLVSIATFPGSDRQMVCWKEWSAGDVNCQSWDGSAFQGVGSETSTEVGAVGRNFDVAPLLGTDNGFILMVGDLNDDWYDFMACTSGSNCDAGTWDSRVLWSTTQLGGTDTRWGQIYADPYNFGNLTLLGVSQTLANGWYRARIYCDASACSQSEAWTGFGGTTSVVYEGASFAFDKYKYYQGEAWHNSTNTAPSVPAGKTPYFINVTARVNVSEQANYSLNIYNWVADSWSMCSAQLLTPNVFSNLMCNITSSPENYRSQDADRFIRIALNSSYTGRILRAALEEDFLQYYLAYDDTNAPPYYDLQSDSQGVDNSTPIPGQNITFYSLWYDDTGLFQHWLEHNATGVFENQTPYDFESTNNTWGNDSMTVPGSVEGMQFSARIWASDYAGNRNLTGNFTIAVGNAPPIVGNTTVNETDVLPGAAVCVNASAIDFGVGVSQVWILVSFANGTAANLTLSDTGCNAGGAGDGRFGALINVSSLVGNFTVNTTFANDSAGNLNMEAPYPQLVVAAYFPPNPIGGSNFYVGYYGTIHTNVVNSTNGAVTIYRGKPTNGTTYVAPSGASISWGKLRIANNATDMPAMDTTLGLTLAVDKLETYFKHQYINMVPSQGGMVSFQLSASATTAQYQSWNGSEWGATAAASTPATAGTVQFTRIRASPVRDEKLLATLDSNSDIDTQAWNGSEWSATTELTDIASTAIRDVIDIGYERVSGDALLVWSNTSTATFCYQVWNGSEYSQQFGMGIGLVGTANTILDLFPQEGSDNIMLLLSNAAATPDLYAILWNGTDFDNSTLQVITTELDTTSDYQSYYGAWEELSGDFNVFYGEDTQTTIFRRSFEGGAWTAPETGASGGDGDIRFVRAAGFPGTNGQTTCWLETQATDLNCQYWDGSSFQGTFSDDTIESGTTRNFDIAPLLSTDGGFVGMYGDLNEDWFDLIVCTSSSNCSAGVWDTRALWSTTQLGGTDTRWGKMYEDSNNPGNLTLLGVSQTAGGGWHRARVYCDAAACEESEPWTGFGGTTSATYDLGSFTFDKHKVPGGYVPLCSLDGTYYLNASDGNFKIGVIYSDEDSSGAYSGGDNIIFCSDFNVNKTDAAGSLSDYEIVFPKSFAENVDMYFDA